MKHTDKIMLLSLLYVQLQKQYQMPSSRVVLLEEDNVKVETKLTQDGSITESKIKLTLRANIRT